MRRDASLQRSEPATAPGIVSSGSPYDATAETTAPACSGSRRIRWYSAPCGLT